MLGAVPPAETQPPTDSSTRAADASGEENGFDVLRLGLAWLVVYTHALLLGGFGEDAVARFSHGQTIAGTLAVLGFFGVSGFLVTRSFVLRADALGFTASRLLRILPAFYVALVLTAFVFAPLISAANPSSPGWHAADAARYVLLNLKVWLGAVTVGGVLTGLPFPSSLNGALWSLFPELLCYAGVLALGLIGAFRAARVILPLAWGATVAAHVAEFFFGERAPLPELLTLTGWAPFFAAFFTGVMIFVYRERLRFGWRSAVLWGVAALLLLRFGGWELCGPLVLPLFVIHLAHCFRWRLRADLSYGVYVLHFPVLQWLTALGVPALGVAAYLSLGTALTVALAVVSWFAIERPALRFKPGRGRG